MTSVSSDNSTNVATTRLRQLHDRLVSAADREGLLDLGYEIVDTPVGALLLAATSNGLVRVAFEQEGFAAVLEQLTASVGARVLSAPQRMRPVRAQLDEYFAGARQTFDVPLDRRLSGDGFRAQVQSALPRIGYGQTLSYGQMAQLVGNPKAVRAVGTACATNPLPIVVPCHRVLRADGSLGGYLGGPQVKRTLLDLEQGAGAGAR